jgi:hypothetical protein
LSSNILFVMLRSLASSYILIFAIKPPVVFIGSLFCMQILCKTSHKANNFSSVA